MFGMVSQYSIDGVVTFEKSKKVNGRAQKRRVNMHLINHLLCVYVRVYA